MPKKGLSAIRKFAVKQQKTLTSRGTNGGVLDGDHPKLRDYGGGLAAKGATSLSELEADKLKCQTIMARLRAANPSISIKEICRHPADAYYASKYKIVNTLRNWAAGYDPRDEKHKPGPKRRAPVHCATAPRCESVAGRSGA